MVKVSVIVPIYNVEKYLCRCIDTLVNQTLKDVEIILVNDASPDNSLQIMMKYKEQYSQIECINLLENKSQGGARNEGIKIAKGKYITFVDSDDYVDHTLLEKLYNKAEETDSDMTYCMFQKVTEDGVWIKNFFLYPPEFTGEINDDLRRGLINKHAYTWGKLYRRDLLINHNILYPENLKYEDSFFMPMVCFYVKKIAMVSEPLYCYVQRKTSVMNSNNKKYHFDQIKVVDLFYDEVKKRDLYIKYKNEIDFYILSRRYINILKKCMNNWDEDSGRILKELKLYIKTYFPNFRKNRYYLNIIGEDRSLMKIYHINTSLAMIWHRYSKLLMKIAGKNLESYLYYNKYYKQHKEKISRLNSYIKSGNYDVLITGAELKKNAFMRYLDDRLTINEIDLKKINQTNNYNDIKDIINLNQLKHKKDDYKIIIIVVNPSFYCSIYEKFELIKDIIYFCNIEEYLEGFIELHTLRRNLEVSE